MQQDAINTHIDAMATALERQGYRLALSGDPEAYKAYVAGLPGYGLSSPLDPARVKLDGKFVWLLVTDRTGNFVGIETGRVIDAPRWRNGLARLIDSLDFVADKRLKPFSVRHPVQLYGRLLYLGGALVDPRHRGRGIMSLLVKLTLAHQCRLHDLDGLPVIVTYHPAYLLRNLPDKAKAWEDLCLMRRTMRELKANG